MNTNYIYDILEIVCIVTQMAVLAIPVITIGVMFVKSMIG